MINFTKSAATNCGGFTNKFIAFLGFVFVFLQSTVTFGQATSPTSFNFTGGASFTLATYSATTFPTNITVGAGTSTTGTFTTDITTDATNGTAATNWNGEGANGISFQGGGSSRRASFLFRGNATGRKDVVVQWTSRTITNSANNNYIALQWRNGTAGAWNDVTGVTTSGVYPYLGATGVVTTNSVTLPAGANNLSDLRIRWIYYEDATGGARDRLAIDDITISTTTNSPTVNGTIAAGEYGVHTDGSNKQGDTYMYWDDTNLHIGVANANTGEGFVLYLDKDPQIPVNGGTNANGTNVGNTYDGSGFAELQYRADLVMYVKNGYREYRTADGSNGWSSPTTAFGAYAESGGNVREFSIPWSAIGGKPAAFNFFSYVTSSGGFVYGQTPTENAGGSIGTGARYSRYYTVSSTTTGSSTLPFSRNSYVFNSASDVNAFGPINAYDFTMNTSSRLISRSGATAGDWNIAGNLVVGNGIIYLGSGGGSYGATTVLGNLNVLGGQFNMDQTTTAMSVAGNVSIATGATLVLSGTIGGDFSTAGNWTNTGTFNPNNRLVTFNGTAAQTITGGTTFSFLTLNNTLGLTLANPVTVNQTLALTSGKITLGANNLTIGSTGTITGATSTNYIVTNGAGNLVRQSVGNTATLFPIGLNVTNYTPVTLTNTTGTSNLSVNVGSTITNAVVNSAKIVNLQWNVTSSAATTATITPVWVAANQAGSFTNTGAGELGNYIPSAYTTYPTTLSTTTTTATGVALQNGSNLIVVGNSNAIRCTTVDNVTAAGASVLSTSSSISWTAPAFCFSDVLIVAATSSNTGTPSGDGTAYTANLAFGSGTALGNGFVVYKGATSPQVVTGLTNGTTYYYKIFTRNGTTWSTGVEVSAIPNIVYCNSTGPATAGSDTITNFTTTGSATNISNTSTYSTNGYGNFTAQAVTESQGGVINYSATLPGVGNGSCFGIFVDWNQDGDFADANETVVSLGSPTQITTNPSGSFTVPLGATLGSTRMRIVVKDAVGAVSSCNTALGNSETEDYTVTVTASVTPVIALADNAIAAGTPNLGTTLNPIYSFSISPTVANATLSGLSIVTAGTYVSADVTNLKAYYQTSATFNSGTATLLSTLTTPGAAGTKTFPSFTSQLIANGATGYIFITADVPCAATGGNIISVNAVTGSNTTFVLGTATGTLTTGTNQTITIPTPNNVTSPAASIAYTSSSISWTAPTGCYDQVLIVARDGAANDGTPTGDGTAYTANLSFGSGSALGSGFVVYKGTATPQVVTGLTNGTTYYYKIFTRKGTLWSTGVEVSAVPNIVFCTPSTSNSATFISNVTTTGGATNLNSTSTYTTGGYINNTSVTPTISQYATGTVNFSVTIAGGTAGIAIWVDWNGNGLFTDSGENVYNSNAYQPTGTTTGSFAVPSGQALGDYRMRVLTDYNATVPVSCSFNGTRGEAEDYTFTVIATPLCLATPAGLLTTTGITTSTATINWNAATPAPANGYEYYYSTSATAPTSGTTPSGSVGAGTLTASLTGLSAATPYYFWVRANCNGTDKSDWVGSGTFVTACASANLTLSEGFNNTFIPACWSTAIVPIGGTATTLQTATKLFYLASGSNPTTSAQEGSHMVQYNSFAVSGDAGGEERLISAPFITTTYPSVDVEFYWRNENNTTYNSGAYLNEGVQVQYSTNGTTWIDAGSFFPRHDGSLASNTAQWNKKLVTLPSGAGSQGLVYVAFKFHSEYGDNLYLDNVVIRPTPDPITITPSPSATICTGDSTSLTASSTAGYTYTWSPATGLSATTGATVTASPTTTTIYTVTGTAGAMSTTQTITVTVNPSPAAVTISPSTSTCPNVISPLTASSLSTGNFSVGSGTTTGANGNTPYRFNVTTEYRVQYLITKAELNAAGITAASSINSLTFNVVSLSGTTASSYVINMANTSATVLSTTFQSPTFTTVFSNSVTITSGLNTHVFSTPFAWDGTSNLLINICHSGNGSGNTQVAVINPGYLATTSNSGTGACSTNTGGSTNANRPVMTFGATINYPITWSPTAGLYTDSGATVAYTGTVAGTVYAKPISTTTYTATATLGSCTKTATTQVTIKTPVGITSATAAESSICPSATTTLTANGVVGDNALVTWYTGTGATGTNLGTGATLVAGPGTYYAFVTGDCGTAEASVVVNANTLPTASISGNNGPAVCSGSDITFSLTGTSGAVVTYNLNGGSNTTATLTGGSATVTVNGATATQTLNLVSVTDGTCPATLSGSSTVVIESTTWDGTSWSNGTPTSTKAVSFTGNYTIGANLDACTISVSNNAVVSVTSGFNVTLNGAITVASGSSFTLNNNANLLQSDPAAVNTGNIIVRRQTNPLIRLDYTLWSSPVTGQGLYAFSPFTFANRYYVYDTTSNLYNNSSIGFNVTGTNAAGVNGIDNANVLFTTGKGYLIRLPYNHPTAPIIFNGSFTGVPNNGTKTITLANVSATQQFNAVGNPYPSPITIAQFATDNTNAIEPTLYFWRKTNNAASASYCTWNTTSGLYGDNGEAFTNSPNGVIQTGQGFLVEAKDGATSLEFNNGQRVANNANQFFRTTTIATPTTQADAIWLNLTGTGAEFSQAVVSYFANATLGADAYDSKYFNDGAVALNMLIGSTAYVIQGRPTFQVTDVVPLNYKVTTAGNYTFAIDHVDGLFAGGAQAIYIKDNQDGSYHNLSTPYTFTSAAGTFADRFELVYQTSLTTNDNNFTANSINVIKQQNDVVIRTGGTTMKEVTIYDIRGRVLVAKTNINASETKINVGTTNQVLLVQVTTVDGFKATKKVVN
ncbi:GEVED domain-containing protein [Flavobacterium koreense]